VPERVAAPEFVTLTVLTSTVGESLLVELPEGEDEGDLDEARVRVRDGDAEGLCDECADNEIVGVPVDVLVDEMDREDVLEPIDVFETEEEPVIVPVVFPVDVEAGEREADFDPADVCVDALLDTAVFDDTAERIGRIVPGAVKDGLGDFVEVLLGIEDDLRGMGGFRKGGYCMGGFRKGGYWR
jgi:hypothetical protein